MTAPDQHKRSAGRIARAIALREAGRFALIALAAVVLSFLLTRALGDPTTFLVSPEAGEAARTALRERLGLDRPMFEQFLRHLRDVLSGEFHLSLRTGTPVLTEILSRIPATLELVLLAVPLTVSLACLAAIVEVYGAWPPVRQLNRALISIGFALPTFATGTALLFVFSYLLGWTPAYGRVSAPTVWGWDSALTSWPGLRSMALPVTVLILAHLPPLAQFIEAGLRKRRESEAYAFARSLGLSQWRLARSYALQPLWPEIAVMAVMQAGTMLAFSVVVETVFQWPGLGRLFMLSLASIDLPAIAAFIVFSTVFVAMLNALCQLLVALLSPVGAARQGEDSAP